MPVGATRERDSRLAEVLFAGLRVGAPKVNTLTWTLIEGTAPGAAPLVRAQRDFPPGHKFDTPGEVALKNVLGMDPDIILNEELVTTVRDAVAEYGTKDLLSLKLPNANAATWNAITYVAFGLHAPIRLASKNGVNFYDLCDRLKMYRGGLRALFDRENPDGHVKPFVLAAIEAGSKPLKYASEALQGDEDVVAAAVEGDGMQLQYASAAIRGSNSIPYTAVGLNGLALKYVSDKLRADENLVGLAVFENGLALRHVLGSLRGDVVIVETATMQNPDALQYAIDPGFTRSKERIEREKAAKLRLAEQLAAAQLQRIKDQRLEEEELDAQQTERMRVWRMRRAANAALPPKLAKPQSMNEWEQREFLESLEVLPPSGDVDDV